MYRSVIVSVASIVTVTAALAGPVATQPAAPSGSRPAKVDAKAVQGKADAAKPEIDLENLPEGIPKRLDPIPQTPPGQEPRTPEEAVAELTKLAGGNRGIIITRQEEETERGVRVTVRSRDQSSGRGEPRTYRSHVFHDGTLTHSTIYRSITKRTGKTVDGKPVMVSHRARYDAEGELTRLNTHEIPMRRLRGEPGEWEDPAVIEAAKSRQLPALPTIAREDLPEDLEEKKALLRSVATNPDKVKIPSYINYRDGEVSTTMAASFETVGESHYVSRRLSQFGIDGDQTIWETVQQGDRYVRYQHHYDLDGNYLRSSSFITTPPKEQDEE